MSAVIDEKRAEISTDVEAVLNYTRNTGARPVNYTFDPHRAYRETAARSMPGR